MQYTEQEMLSKDIDWMVGIGFHFVHAASAGGQLPTVIQQAKEDNQEYYSKICKLPDFFTNEHIEVNPLLRDILRIDQQKEQYQMVLKTLKIDFGNDVIATYIEKLYIPAFLRFARKGFISFDRSNKWEAEDNNYHWVVRPKIQDFKEKLLADIKFPQLPSNKETFHEITMQTRSNTPIPLVDFVNTLYE